MAYIHTYKDNTHETLHFTMTVPTVDTDPISFAATHLYSPACEGWIWFIDRTFCNPIVTLCLIQLYEGKGNPDAWQIKLMLLPSSTEYEGR